MRVLVTGGNRYIGRSLVEELARRGHQVTVFNSHPSQLPDGVRRLHGDRQQPGVIEEVLGHQVLLPAYLRVIQISLIN